MHAIAVSDGTSQATSTEVAGVRVSQLMFAPDVALPPHEHERPCLAVVLAGGVGKRFSSRRLGVACGGALAMPAQIRHADRFDSASTRILVVEPDGPFLEGIAPYTSVFRDVHAFPPGWLVPEARQLTMELALVDAASRLAIEAGVLGLIAGATRAVVEPRRSRRRPRWLATVEERLRAEPPLQLSIAELAADADVHPIHLARVFRAHYGVGPAEYLRRLRLEWAARQLTGRDVALATIAADAGFADQAHFTRSFKAATGLTPGRYRDAARQGLVVSKDFPAPTERPGARADLGHGPRGYSADAMPVGRVQDADVVRD